MFTVANSLSCLRNMAAPWRIPREFEVLPPRPFRVRKDQSGPTASATPHPKLNLVDALHCIVLHCILVRLCVLAVYSGHRCITRAFPSEARPLRSSEAWHPAQ
jgi:hypothetical protein